VVVKLCCASGFCRALTHACRAIWHRTISQAANSGAQLSLERQPLHGLDVVHQFAGRAVGCLHVPEMRDLRPVVADVGDRAEKLVHGHVVAGAGNISAALLLDLPARGFS
jgi:hypothetical protein